LGTDTVTGERVAVRRAALGDGAGARAERDALRREARLLARLGRAGLAARTLALIGRQDALHLVRAHVPGRPLDTWVAERLPQDGAPGVPWAQARPVALALAALVGGARAEGLPLASLSPGHVVVRPDGAVRLTGTAACAEPGSLAAARARRGADGQALGALLFLLATGRLPLLAEDFPEARPGTPEPPSATARLSRWLAAAARQGETARRLAPVVLGLRAADPAQRWTADRARAVLAVAH
ncbi:hypothetical protein ACFV0G_37530, partial [Kitasatospora sp. NPDC059571]